MSFLFGSKSKPAETKFTQLTNLDEGQTTLQTALETLLNEQLGEGVSSYPGTYTAGESETQTQLFSLVSKLLGGTGSMQSEGTNFLTSLMEPYDDTKAKSYWQSAVYDPAMESWEQDISPDILEQFAAYDAAGSGSAQKALSNAGVKLETGLASSLADTLMKYEKQYKDQGLTATNYGLNYPLNLVSMLQTAAGTQRSITGDQLYETYQDWSTEQDYNNPWLSYLNSTLNRETFTNQAYQTGGSQGQSGILGSLLGAGATILGSVLGGPAGGMLGKAASSAMTGALS